MTRARLILLLAILLPILAAVLFIPDWFEDPRQLALGEWKEHSTRGYVEVEEERIRTRGMGRTGKITYSWVQTDDEPYTMRVKARGHEVTAHITFNGSDEALVLFEIMHLLPPAAARELRKRNKAANRPEDEFYMLFRRVSTEK